MLVTNYWALLINVSTNTEEEHPMNNLLVI